jgi:hypothetical protein
MTCEECGKEDEGTYWLCSNACALSYAKKRGRTDCALCSYDVKTGRMGNHNTTKICAECRSRSENREWIHKKDEHADKLIETKNEELVRFREQQDNPLPELTPLTRQIAQLIVEGERVPYTYRDRKGVSHGVRYRWRAFTVRRLAKKLGCRPMVVQRVIDSIEK